MWDTIYRQNICRLTYKTASRPTGWDGSVGHLDGYDASYWLRYCNTVKLIWRRKIKQMKTRLIWKYAVYYRASKLTVYRRTYKTASGPTGWDGIVVLLDGYDASWWLSFSNTVKLIWSRKVKQMKASLIWKYALYYMASKLNVYRLTNKTTSPPTVWDGIVVGDVEAQRHSI